jgi:molybdate transport system substrate-binding protein
VPCGKLAAQALANVGVSIAHPSREVDVKAVVTKVRLGEADAGIVYATDVRAAGSGVTGVPIPDAQNVVARYPITVLKGARPGAGAFVDFILSPSGAAILQRYGFQIP